MQLAIRDATPEDAAALTALRKVLFGETDFLMFGTDEYAVAAAELASQLARIATSGHSRILVAADGPGLVGTSIVAGSSIPRRRHAATVVLGVRRSHWGRGIGSALLAEAVRWARTVGISRLELSVIVENTRARSLYEKAGFRIEATRRRAYMIDGRAVDDHLMALVFDG